MRINRVMASAVASVLALGAVAPAFADNDHRRDHDRREWREDRREWRQDRRDWERDRREARRDWACVARPTGTSGSAMTAATCCWWPSPPV